MSGFATLSRAMFLGFVRDRAALIFSILLPVLFLLFFGSIYKNTSAPKINVITVGQVQLLTRARQGDPALAKVLTISHATLRARGARRRAQGRRRRGCAAAR